MLSQRATGVVQIIFSGIFFGFLGIFGKSAFARGISPGELLGLRFLTSSVILGALLFIFKKNAFKMNQREKTTSILLGVLGYAVFSSCYFFALKGISASLTVMLLYVYPTIVAVGASVFYGEPLGRNGRIALVLTSAGLVGLMWGEWQVSRPLFLLLGLASALFYATYILISRKLLRLVNPLGSSFFVQLGAGITLCLVFFSSVWRPMQIISENGGLIFGMAIVCSLIPLTLFLQGLQKIASAEASILSTTEPISAVIVAGLFLGERLTPLQAIGAALVISGLVLISLKEKTRTEQ